MHFQENDERLVAAFAEMRDLRSFRQAPEKLSSMLQKIQSLKEVPPHMTEVSLAELKQAATSIMYSMMTNDLGMGIDIGYFMD